MRKRIMLHLTAFVVLVPCVLLLNDSGEWWLNVIGMVYVGSLAIILTESKRAKKFLCEYYREILRLENMM